MQTVLTYFILFVTGLALQAQNTIEVKIVNLSNDEGDVKVGLYNKAGSFLNNEFKSNTINIQDGIATMTFTDIPDGTYAVSIFHDEDSNGELNMLMGMIPTEDYGCSNNAKGMFGPPKWDDAKFELRNNQLKRVNISL